MTRAYFRGGPLDGEMRVLPHAMGTFEVAAPGEVNWSVATADAEPVPLRRGLYVLVPKELDPLWAVGRLYKWEGWR